VLAYHLAESGQPERAATYWRKAGELAVRRAANREAVGHFRRALTLVEAQPEGAERWRAELAILSQLAPPIMAVYGWAAPEAGAVVERAAELGRRLPSSAEIAPAIANLWIYNAASGRFDRADEISTDLFRIARELDDSEILLQAHHCAWATRFFRGEFKDSAKHIEAGVAIYDRERHAHHRHVYLGHDPRVCSLNFGASVQFILGYPDQAYQLAREGVALARELDHAPSLGNALWRACEAFAFSGDNDALEAAAIELIALTDVHGLPMRRAHGFNLLGWALTRSGNTAEGLSYMLETQQALSRMGSLVHATMALGFHAKALLVAGHFAEGLAEVERTISIATQGGERSYLAWLYRVRAAGLLHLRGSADPQIETSLKQALGVARDQGAKGWELGAATDLARLWAEQGRRADAHELLAPLYGWFTEGFDTTDLKDAKALLDQLT
jgi:predicted ATPase